MFKNVSATLFIMVIAMLSSFAVTIFLGRSLSISDFGEFALLKQLFLIGSTVAIFGLDYSYIKNFHGTPNSSKRAHLVTLGILIVFSLVVAIIVGLVYKLEVSKLILIFCGITLGSVNLYLAAIYRLKNKFLQAQLFAGGWKIVMLGLLGILLLTGIAVDITSIYYIWVISFLVFSVFLISLIFKTPGSPQAGSNLKDYLSFGLMFWLINSTGLIAGGVDKLFIPLVYDASALGIFTGVSFIFTISLTMLGSAVGYVIFPKISAGHRIPARKLILPLLLIIVGALGVFQLFGLKLVSLFFAGKYDEYINRELIFYFTILGSLQIVHVILHHYLSGLSNRKQLFQYWALSVLFIGIFVTLLYGLKTDSGFNLMNLTILILLIRLGKVISMSGLLRYVSR